MDREVAADWFDRMMADFDFTFRRFTQNIPRATCSSFDDSDRSSMISSSLRSNFKAIEYSEEEVDDLQFRPEDSLSP